MRTKELYKEKPRVNVITLGCSKNLVDSEVLMGQLRGSDFEVTHEESANRGDDIVVINTCGFIDNAKQESIDTILRYNQLKEQGKIGKLFVTGCLSERYKPELEKEIPEVDEYFGSNEMVRLLKTIGADYRHELIGERLLTTPAHFAFFKISEGCDRPCSFCAIPLMRGKHVSKPLEELLTEARKLASRGTKELVLIAQDSTYYGIDLYGKRTLPDLLRRLSETEGIEWLRLQYAYPSGFPEEVLDVMRERPAICNYLDMPLQHISDPMLRSMRRGITKEKTLRLIQDIREKVPGIALRTTLISGYPGETQQDHEELLRFVEKTRFDRLGVFSYSHEENTHAWSLEDDVPEEVKQERLEEIMSLQQGISYELNQQKVGGTFKVLVDKKEGGYFVGRTEFDSPEVDNEVLIEARDQYVSIGDFCNVNITGAEEFDLYGVPVV
ncbi:MAG TPA: 30S ribosomal protein S12 methylthiotransferase RimO [Anseongella sp.]|nr:30S ribosomal protein S12 methylthiotransferase RimO [Anseongella sp.]